MGRLSYPAAGEALPAPLPPERRTVGQLVAETIRLYGARFWIVLPVGLSIAILDAISDGVSSDRDKTEWFALIMLAGGPLISASYVGASAILASRRVRSRDVLRAYGVALVVFAPFAVLTAFFLLPGLLWLALVGLVVPVILSEGSPIGRAFSRALELAKVDYVHVVGSLCTLILLFVLTRGVLGFLLRDQAGTTVRVAGFLADLVLSPIIFLGSALVYVDQDARVRLRERLRLERETGVARLS